jgi:hypothetical protein
MLSLISLFSLSLNNSFALFFSSASASLKLLNTSRSKYSFLLSGILPSKFTATKSFGSGTIFGCSSGIISGIAQN